MEFIIDFYKGLDTLNLIIFWGIIIVIILLLIFSCILINKNKKLKHLVDKKNNEQKNDSPRNDKELPIKINNLEKELVLEEPNTEEKTSVILPSIPEIPKEKQNEQPENISRPIETEKTFVAEEHVMEYNSDLFSLTNIKKTSEPQAEPTTNRPKSTISSIEIPTKPYQRNVLREMSLGQTSPIGITKPIKKEDKKVEMAKDLEESLNQEQKEVFPSKTEIIKKQEELPKEAKQIVKKELTNIEHSSPRKTEIRNDTKNEPLERKNTFVEPQRISKEETIPEKEIKTNNIDNQAQSLLNSISKPVEPLPKKSSSEKYLEEVSRKLAEAEVPDEIERTDYELEQEENAIISYTELMEKKDSIQTIDEEDAVISIEELMNRNNQKTEEPPIVKEDTKLYNLSEEEENDNFIKELKQFRNDL